MNSKSQKKVILEVQNASKRFRKNSIIRTIFENVNFTLQTGEILAISGKSGTGKTLALQCLLGLEDLDEGEIIFEEQSFTKLSEKEKELIRKEDFSIILKEDNLFEDLSIADNFQIAQSIAGKLDEEKKQDLMENLIKILNLQNLLDKKASNLDYLDYQKASLGIALSTSPKLLFLDEPTGNLSDTETEEFLQILKDLNKSLITGIIIASNDAKVTVKVNKVVRL